MTEPAPWTSRHDEILAAIAANPPDRRFHYPIRHGTMRVGIYAPRGADPQSPHDQDELYLVIRGTGHFVKNAERIAFSPGDVLFVEAGATHRFEDFSDDFETWVVFWGPKGGER
ncbi:MAG: cupin domain-containing protein [Betaproteobacteria bacterium]|nr:cupin domain-containing protein [Betaproteobacteria bacterium]